MVLGRKLREFEGTLLVGIDKFWKPWKLDKSWKICYIYNTMAMVKKSPIIILEEDCYTKDFTIRIAGQDRGSIVTTIPREVVEREARRQGLSVVEFVKGFKAEWLFNNFGGSLLRFIPRKEKSKENIDRT